MIYKPVNPALQPIGKKNGGCPNGWVGCNPNTWGKSGGGFAVDISVGVAQPVATIAAVADANCYYVRRKVFIEGVGLVRQRMLVCD